MIRYSSAPLYFLCRILQVRGSVFWRALLVAIPCAVICTVFRALYKNQATRKHFEFLSSKSSILMETAPWNNFGVLVGFLIIFRTSQAYSRFWEGCTACHRMRTEWFECCSQFVAGTRSSKANKADVQKFRRTITSLFSLLFCVALVDVYDTAHHRHQDLATIGYELLGVIDRKSLQLLKQADSRTHTVYQWIIHAALHAADQGITTFPAGNLAFTRLANGLTIFCDLQRIAQVQFPFPYVQVCDALMVLHWILSPFLIATWVDDPGVAFVFCFLQVFIIWSLNFIAIEIEAPFGKDMNDLDTKGLQRENNRNLQVLLVTVAAHLPEASDEHADVLCWTPSDKNSAHLWSAEGPEVVVGVAANVEPSGRKVGWVA